MAFSADDLPPLLCRLIDNAQASPSTRDTTQRNLAEGRPAASQDQQILFDAINKAEAVELYSAVRKVNPTASIEIGFCCGGSGLAILKALEDNKRGEHFACDPYQSTYARGAGLRNVQAAGLQARLRFHEAFPEAVVPGFPRIQFAFIDASHLFDLSLLDYVLVDKLLDVGGVVGFHDLWMPSLQKLVRYILSNRKYEVYHLADNHAAKVPVGRLRLLAANVARFVPGSEKIFAPELLQPWGTFGIAGNIAFLRKTGEDQRDWRHFVPF
jgi:predicted O-methyltransferase YrrM